MNESTKIEKEVVTFYAMDMCVGLNAIYLLALINQIRHNTNKIAAPATNKELAASYNLHSFFRSLIISFPCDISSRTFTNSS